MLTVTTTLKQQDRPVLPYLVEAVRAHTEGRKAPSLLPQPGSETRIAA